MKTLKALDVSENTHWSDFFEEVDYKTFREYLDEYYEEFGCTSNFFMGWQDYYDFNLRSGKYEVGSFENTQECLIARHYNDYGLTFYLRKDR